MKGGQSDNSRGFTIVETLIVLAVSGLILFSALAVVNGRQNRTQFDVSIRQAQQFLQSTVNEVSSGYYPSQNNFTCTGQVKGATKSQPKITTTAKQQGTNQGCIFLGKVIQFAPAGNDGQVTAITLAGNSKDNTGSDVSTIGTAQPFAIYPGTGAGSSPVKAVTESELQYGLTVQRVYTTSTDLSDTTQTNVGAFALVTSFPGTDSYGTQSGSNNVDLYAIIGSSIGQTTTNLVDLVNKNLPDGGANFKRVGSINICLASAGTNQSGLVTIGGAGSQSSVSLQVKRGSTTC